MLKDFIRQIMERQEQAQKDAQREEVIRNAGPMPGPQPGFQAMQGIDVQPGVNPFAQAAQNAGFSDFANAQPPTPAPAPQMPATPTPAPAAPQQPPQTMINSPHNFGIFRGSMSPTDMHWSSGNLTNQRASAQALRGGGQNG